MRINKKHLNVSEKRKSFFSLKSMVVNHPVCGYQVMIKKWWFPIWKVKSYINGVNMFYELQDAINWIEDGFPESKDETVVIWERV